MKTILLTGATGYLGGNLAKMLLDKGYFVVAIALDKNEKFLYENHKNTKVYYLSETKIDDIFAENKIDIVIHTATLYGRKNEQNTDMIRANVEFPVSVLMEAISHDVQAFINTDTILVENINPYSLTKSQFSKWLQMYSEKIKCINIRLDHFYGPNDNSVKFVSWIIKQLQENVDKIDLTEGSQTRDFIYIDDVVNVYSCILDNLSKISAGKINNFEVGTNNKTSIKRLVLILKELLKNNTTILNFGAVPYRKNEVLDYEVDTTALRLLGWEPKVVDIKDGLQKILEKEVLV